MAIVKDKKKGHRFGYKSFCSTTDLDSGIQILKKQFLSCTTYTAFLEAL